MTPRPCSVEGCDVVGKATRGMCVKHYRTWLTHTPPDERGASPRASRRFEDFLEQAPNGCIVWTGLKIRKGYGFWAGGGVRGLAHRISLDRVTPCPDPALFACHHCDNPPCVNPDHLYWGTVQDNMRDYVERIGVHNKGVYQTHCKNGHEMTGDNVRIAGRARHRICRTCDNVRSRDRQRRIREARRVELG